RSCCAATSSLVAIHTSIKNVLRNMFLFSASLHGVGDDPGERARRERVGAAHARDALGQQALAAVARLPFFPARQTPFKQKQADAPGGRNVSGAPPWESAPWAPSTGTCS